MVYSGQPMRGSMGFGNLGGTFRGQPPRDVVMLVAVVFATFAMQFFDTTRIIPAVLHLSPLLWQSGFLWQLVTYAFTGFGAPSFWILLEMLILFWFARDVFGRLGRRRFWRLLVTGSAVAALAAAVAELLVETLTGAPLTFLPFQLMQGQRMLLVILLVAFANIYGDATIYLFFVLPVPARWMVWLGIAFGFVAFLSTKDFSGLVGICAATAFTWLSLAGRGSGPSLRRLWLQLKQRRLASRLDRLRRQRDLHLVPPPGKPGKGPTIN
jgi:hypothetical protein